MFQKVLVANRGEIACRIIKSLQDLGICAVAVYSEADANASHVTMADEAYLLGPAAANESYLNTAKILQIMAENQIDAVHPGYGFLSENVTFAKACAEQDVVFIGPTTEQILQFGLKHEARALAEQADVPLVPGTGLLVTVEEAVTAADEIGYPVMLKSTAGGGGIGMKICADATELSSNFETIKRLGKNYFNDDGIFLEKYIETARHIEVQVFGDGSGHVVTLGERDCSVQRRNQKVIEETPAPGISEETRNALYAAAKSLTQSVNYRSAGTVEFIYDTQSQGFYFLEVNTRLQVEHGITEEVFGIDLVSWMVQLAAGNNPIADINSLTPKGCAMEFRVYAEDPGKDYQPSTGTITCASFPDNIRCDRWIQAGTEVSAFYDPLMAKVIVSGDNREQTLAKAEEALSKTRISGFESNLYLLRQISRFSSFVSGDVHTKMLNDLTYSVRSIEVIEPGPQTTVQDYPGRQGYWGIGVPPSGPMDSLSFRLANRLVGNAECAAAIEMTVTGGQFRFNTSTTIAITGAQAAITLNGQAIEANQAITVQAGDELSIGNFTQGQRSYLALRGGLDIPDYMGSRSTFILGKFGGHGGRTLAHGDILHLADDIDTAVESKLTLAPALTDAWKIGVMIGPHGAPEFFTPEDVETFFNTDWEVHYNSSRTGVRLIGPAPQWAREDGEEAGLHPSNIHDNAYAIGSIDFTGDMPVVLGPDGPSLGGFVCPVTIVQAELWKMGQVKPGDTIRFYPVTEAEALALEVAQEAYVSELITEEAPAFTPYGSHVEPAIIKELSKYNVIYRRAGDKYLLIEYGELKIDMEMRFRVHNLEQALQELQLEGLLDLTPGIRSLQIHYNNRVLPLKQLLSILEDLETRLAEDDGPRRIRSRIVHMPLSWDDISARLASEKYTQSVRPDAPWCPDNKEFIRRVNGLNSVEDVYDIVFGARYIVMGLGDVYLGAPVSIPYDPRHRLVTTKYNPARTWTAENAVGIGGAYMGIYGMEGPGGYQLVGRTVQTWNTYNQTRNFTKPWLFRCFDQIRFYPVTHEELSKMRRELPHDTQTLRIEESEFDLDDYLSFLDENQESISVFKNTQQDAFDAERQNWIDNGLLNFQAEENVLLESDAIELAEGCEAIKSTIAGSLWKVLVEPGQSISQGEPLAILECMKMEIEIPSPYEGVVVDLYAQAGDAIKPGQIIAAVK